MTKIEARLADLGLQLPTLPPWDSSQIPFALVRVVGTHAYISGHPPFNADGTLTMLGKVGADLTVEQGYQAARLAGLTILASLKSELGNLDRITAWLRVCGLVNSAPGFMQQTAVLNGFSELIVEVFGARVGKHSRIAAGAAEMPCNVPMEIETEVEISI